MFKSQKSIANIVFKQNLFGQVLTNIKFISYYFEEDKDCDKNLQIAAPRGEGFI